MSSCVAAVDGYSDFIKSKTWTPQECGIDFKSEFKAPLFSFQKDLVRWSLRLGRSAIFADCGLGKTIMQLEWARVVAEHSGSPVLILSPLAVAAQTVREAGRFGLPAMYARDQSQASGDVVVANYEMLEHFDAASFGGVVLDESSILKSYTGATRTLIIEQFKETPYKLACTATPAPNDFMELGNHAAFLGVMTREEMLAMFFVHDGGETQKWRLKGHAEDAFWRWCASWAAVVRSPSDLGYSDDGFILPPLSVNEHCVDVSASHAQAGMLFALEAETLQERIAARRSTTDDRARVVADLVNGNTEQWVVWCNLNSESEVAARLINGAVEVRGSDTAEHKQQAMLDFVDGKIRVIVSKPSIAGFGMNWQHCHNVAFLGLSDSYEQYYQAMRRCWRFGQTQPVNVHIVIASTEGAVLRNVMQKEGATKIMSEEMVRYSKESVTKAEKISKSEYATSTANGEKWTMMLGDCVERVKELRDESIDYSVFSPPFASLYTYSDSPRDMGNSANHDEFYRHFRFLVDELFRVTRPGRLLSFHCMNLPTSKVRDGVIGLTDFRGILIKAFRDAGWVYHSEVVIWKDPVTAMQRTKALGLLYKQLRKDSAMCRQGIPDYLVTMRKPGENTKPISHTHEEFPVEFWQRYASPVWMDINPTRTLQHMAAREEKDERHICPLQLDVIERAIDLWSAEGDVVLSPFAGIGSEGYCAVRKGRRFVGIELKQSYYDIACDNLREASGEGVRQLQMFA